VNGATFTLTGLEKTVKEVSFTSPDNENFSLQKVEFEQKGDTIKVKVPSLRYWDLLVFQF
jgi:hypothetical protein